MRWRLYLGITICLLLTLACNMASGNFPVPTTGTVIGPAANFGTTDLTSLAAQPTATMAASQASTGTGCTPRSDWPTTVVGQGETLSAIAQRTDSTVNDLV